MRFSDGMTFDTSGDLRKVRKSDGLYVVGNGMLVPVNDDEEARNLIESLKPKPLAVEVPPDTEESVRKYIENDTHFLIISDETKYTPDPHFDGVWKVTNVTSPDGMKLIVIVYLAGYENGCTGRIRRYTDHECSNPKWELDSLDE